MVWKRAVFLTAFLIACFTAYGGLLAAYIGSDCRKAVPFTVISVAAIGIGFVGILLSIIWIQMAKGSKAWYEHYENVIECFVKNHSSGNLNVFAGGDYRPLLKDTFYRREVFARSGRLESNPLCNWLTSTSGGCYSASRIIVVMGHLFFGLWSVVISFHLVYLCEHQELFNKQLGRFAGPRVSSSSLIGYFCLSTIGVVLVGGFIHWISGFFTNSSYLSDVRNSKTNRKKVFATIRKNKTSLKTCEASC